MKRFFIIALCVSLFGTVNTVWAFDNGQDDKTPAKKECVEKKADTSKEGAKACCAAKKENCAAKAGETKACCAEKKGNCAANKTGETKACAEKKECPKAASSCTSKDATTDTKSSGKKAN